jgi:hypothetical protein
MKIAQIKKSITEFFMQKAITQEQLENFKITISQLAPSEEKREALLSLIDDKTKHFKAISGLKLKPRVTVTQKEKASTLTLKEAKERWDEKQSKETKVPNKFRTTSKEDILGKDINCWGVFLPTRVHLLAKTLGIKPKTLIKLLDNENVTRRTSVLTQEEVIPHLEVLQKLAADRTNGVYNSIEYRGFKIEREELKKERAKKMHMARFISVGMKS